MQGLPHYDERDAGKSTGGLGIFHTCLQSDAGVLMLRCLQMTAEDSVQNPALFHVLLDYLDEQQTPAADVQRFVDRWHRQRPHEAFPCPVCYLAGEEQPLAALPVQGEFTPLRCVACLTQFDVPLDD